MIKIQKLLQKQSEKDIALKDVMISILCICILYPGVYNVPYNLIFFPAPFFVVKYWFFSLKFPSPLPSSSQRGTRKKGNIHCSWGGGGGYHLEKIVLGKISIFPIIHNNPFLFWDTMHYVPYCWTLKYFSWTPGQHLSGIHLRHLIYHILSEISGNN